MRTFTKTDVDEEFPLLCDDVTEAIAHAPIVRLNRLHPLCQIHNFYLKLESCLPSGSIKDKNAAYLVKDAEKNGYIASGGTIIESSSGNFGIALATVGAARGYSVIIVVDAKTPLPTRRILNAYGAKLVDVPLELADANGSMQVARMQKAQELASQIPGAWYPCQHYNPRNTDIHEIVTAKEIERAFQGAPDAIVIGVSTAGQIAGISRYFRKHYPKTRLIGVDVAGSAIFGAPPHPYKMTGLGLSFIPPNFDTKMIDAAYNVRDSLSFSVCHALARQEGLLLGGSTGAIVAAGLADARNYQTPQRILLLNPDRGDRYLETIYHPVWLEEQGIELLGGSKLLGAIATLNSVISRGLSENYG
jgi:cysteine synthase A